MSRMNFCRSKVWCLTAPRHWTAKWRQVLVLELKITTAALVYGLGAVFICNSKQPLVLIVFLGSDVQLSNQEAGRWDAAWGHPGRIHPNITRWTSLSYSHGVKELNRNLMLRFQAEVWDVVHGTVFEQLLFESSVTALSFVPVRCQCRTECDSESWARQ